MNPRLFSDSWKNQSSVAVIEKVKESLNNYKKRLTDNDNYALKSLFNNCVDEDKRDCVSLMFDFLKRYTFSNLGIKLAALKGLCAALEINSQQLERIEHQLVRVNALHSKELIAIAACIDAIKFLLDLNEDEFTLKRMSYAK